MLCRRCQSDNPPQNAFCHSCGTPLGSPAPPPAQAPAPGMVLCSLCGTENPKKMQFCRTCGSQLAASSAGQVAAAPATAASPVFAPQDGVGARAMAPTAPAPALGVMCKRCGGQGDPNARFCKFCGAAFEA